ncbi:MAG: homoserine dehydrogenase [Rhodospirillales bacterium]|nr:homoserine dehydrogenase [Rhodospirillales bacterium]MBO6787131.1 homoserine dehydrogenase [Rhodospirillales bacterium]
MNFDALFAAHAGKVVRVGLVGVGDFGATLLAQSRNMSNMQIVAACDTDGARMARAVSGAGFSPDDIFMTDDITGGDVPDFDVLVEATGHPEAAAGIAEWAIGNHRHVVMASKETAIVVGPLLHRMAWDAGLVYTEVEGDQPSLLIGLVSWARTLGLDIIMAGKASEYDFVLGPDDTLGWCGREKAASGLAELWDKTAAGWPDVAATRRDAVHAAGFPDHVVSDFCEMGVVANATGLSADRPGFHAPLLRAVEVADAFQRAEDGGLLAGEGCIDVFNCFRRHDEQSFAGGVFVVVRCEDDATWKLLAEKGHVVAKNGKAAMLSLPQHLLGVEAPISVLSAGLLGLPTGAYDPRPHVDLVARAARDFNKGEELSMTNMHKHEVAGLDPELVPAFAFSGDGPCPYYLVTGRTLATDVKAGELLREDMFEPIPETALKRLRLEQDRMFETGAAGS